jgi:hypothetical protein
LVVGVLYGSGICVAHVFLEKLGGEMKVKLQGLSLAVTCRCGRPMIFSIEGYFCPARGGWKFFLHDKPISYADARKRID